MRISGLIVLSIVLVVGNVASAQNAPIDFETGGNGTNWTWTTFENGGNEPFGIVVNPDTSGINTSSTVGSMTTLTVGAPWAGVESQHGADIGSFSWDVSNSTVKIMVYKSVISDVGLKFAEANGEAQPEIKIANSLTNEWEELTFDLSGHIGLGATGILDQIIIFPDFDAGRTTDNLCYFDNISFSAQIQAPTPVAHAPTPTVPSTDVISVFSNAYTSITGTDFYPNWGQATVAREVDIEGNNTLLYSGLNYQGIVLGSNQNISEMGYLHVDFWSANSTALNVFIISPGPVETSYALPVSSETWVSVEVPLSSFPLVDLSDVFQFKFEGNGDVYLDNLYFYSATTDIEDEDLPDNFVLKQNYPNPFNSTTTIRYSVPSYSSVSLIIYDIKGEVIASLNDSYQAEGFYQVHWDGTDKVGNQVSTGVYLARLQIGGYIKIIRMALLK